MSWGRVGRLASGMGGRKPREMTGGRGLVEMAMERGIAPGEATLVDEALEAADEVLAQRLGMGLITGIAVINPASQGTRLACRAAAGSVLPGTRLPLVERPDRRRCLIQEYRGFGRGEEQRVTVLGEPAAAPAQLTGGA